MFTNAIVRTPGRSIVQGLANAQLGPPDYEAARIQHDAYVNALKACGLEVLVLPANEDLPDSTFMEDVALLTKECAIITNPGAPTRRGETVGLRDVLSGFYDEIQEVHQPGTVEGGDIMMVGRHFYIGISERTNENGAQQVIDILEKFKMRGSLIHLEKMLHLKTGVSYLEENNLVVSGEMRKKEAFRSFNLLEIEDDESYAANCVWINGTVLIPTGYPKARARIEGAGYSIREIDVSEFRKLDGGLSCLSLRF